MATMDTQAPDAPPVRQGLYEASSQFKHWRFSPGQLRTMRENMTHAAVATIRAAFERDEAGSSSKLVFLTPEDEIALVRHYVTKIPQLCAHFRFSEELEATAISYMKRFYLKNTVMDHHPKNIMLTALFLAAKTCNRMVAINDYVNNIPKTNDKEVLALEFPLAQSLNFEFAVWHAHRALWGLYLDMQSLDPPPAQDALHSAHKVALDLVRRSRLTDVELLYTPSQIALACMHRANAQLAQPWLTNKVERDLTIPLETTASILDTISLIIDADGAPPPLEVVREIDKRLKLCKNPEKVIGSRAFLRREAEKDAVNAAKRKKKADRARAVMAADDPFGDGMGANNGAPPATNGADSRMDVDSVF